MLNTHKGEIGVKIRMKSRANKHEQLGELVKRKMANVDTQIHTDLSN